MFHHVFFFTGAAVVLVFQPKTDTAICSVLDFEQRHVIVARHRHLFAFQGQHLDKILRIVDGAAFHHVERVGETVVAAEVLHQAFECNPIFLIELRHLRRHVAHVERLFVGLQRVGAVARSHHVSAVVTDAFVGVARKSLRRGEQRVESELAASLYAGGARFRVESERHPARMMPMCVVADGEVDRRILSTERRFHAVHKIAFVGVALELRHFESQRRQTVGFAARVAAPPCRGLRRNRRQTVHDAGGGRKRFEGLPLRGRHTERERHGAIQRRREERLNFHS